MAKNKDINIVLIAGDLTYNGELESHKEMIAKLYRLKNAGKRVFVITATHDFGKSLQSNTKALTDLPRPLRGSISLSSITHLEGMKLSQKTKNPPPTA